MLNRRGFFGTIVGAVFSRFARIFKPATAVLPATWMMGYVDNFFAAHPLSRLKDRSRICDGGDKLIETLMYDRNTDSDW